MKAALKSLLKKWFPTIHPLPAKRLARWEKELLAAPSDIKDEETIKHVEILDRLNDKECWVRNPQRRLRGINLIPVTLGLITSLVLTVNDFIKERKSNESEIYHWVDVAKKEYGEKFYLRNDLPDYLNGMNYIGDDKNLSLRKYLHYRYNYYTYSDYLLKVDLGFLLLYLLIIPPFFIVYFSGRDRHH